MESQYPKLTFNTKFVYLRSVFSEILKFFDFTSFLSRKKRLFLKKSVFFYFFIFFLHGIGSWYHKLSFKTSLAKIGSLFLEIFIILFFSETRFGKMLFGQKVQKFWEHIKKLYRSLIYSLRAFI